jgi:transposase-like protein
LEGLAFLRFRGWDFWGKKGSMDHSKRGRRYDKQFKADAAALVQSGRTAVEVARDLGVSTWSVRHWIRQAQQGALSESRKLASETPAQREMRRMQQEIDYLRRQRDILKKALAIVSDSNPSSDSK